MVFEQIDKLKRQYTDKYVVVDDGRPELRRFLGAIGVVKTVNMNGRALVQFEIADHPAWYDIDVRHLKVVDRPADERSAEAASVPRSAPAPAATGAPKEAKTPIAATAKPGMTVDQVLAAARTVSGGAASAGPDLAQPGSGPGASPSPSRKVDPKKMSVEQVVAAARGQATAGSPPAAAGDVGSPPSPAGPAKRETRPMSTAEILAAARAQRPTTSSRQPQTSHQPDSACARSEAAADTVEESSAEPPPAETAPSSATPASSAAPPRPEKLPTTVEEIIAYCRQRDGGG